MSSFIYPQNLIVGFRERKDTYTQKLGFITYFYPNGEIAKKSAFYSWSSDDIEKIEIINKPTNGFIINKSITHNSDFASSNKIRIYHPEGFEFEISIENLIELTNRTNIIAQEIMCDCVIVWKGNNPYLLPTNTKTYKVLQNKTVEKAFNPNDNISQNYIYSSKKYPKLFWISGKKFLILEENRLVNINPNILIGVSEEENTEEEKHNYNEIAKFLDAKNNQIICPPSIEAINLFREHSLENYPKTNMSQRDLENLLKGFLQKLIRNNVGNIENLWYIFNSLTLNNIKYNINIEKELDLSLIKYNEDYYLLLENAPMIGNSSVQSYLEKNCGVVNVINGLYYISEVN